MVLMITVTDLHRLTGLLVNQASVMFVILVGLQ